MSELKYPFLDLYSVNAPLLQELSAAASRVVHSGRYIGGEEVLNFEHALQNVTRCGYAVGVSNGLDALRLIFKSYVELGKLQPGDEVIVPANTYIASVLAVSDAGLTPVLVEPDPRTLNMDTSLIENAITLRTKAILTVHLYGRACYDAAMAEAVRRHSLLLIEDNAQAIGAQAEIPGLSGCNKTGALGHAAAFSFYPTKNVGALGDAGAVTTDDRELAHTVRTLANYGSDRRYHNIYQGYNCRLDPIQAAMLSVKLRYLESETAHRRMLAAVYNADISNPRVVKPLMTQPDLCVWHQYVILSQCRDQLSEYLHNNGVGTDIHYAVPPHLQPCYDGQFDEPLPITETLANQVLSLPISSATSESDARDIAEIINRFSL